MMVRAGIRSLKSEKNTGVDGGAEGWRQGIQFKDGVHMVAKARG